MLSNLIWKYYAEYQRGLIASRLFGYSLDWVIIRTHMMARYWLPAESILRENDAEFDLYLLMFEGQAKKSVMPWQYCWLQLAMMTDHFVVGLWPILNTPSSSHLNKVSWQVLWCDIIIVIIRQLCYVCWVMYCVLIEKTDRYNFQSKY